MENKKGRVAMMFVGFVFLVVFMGIGLGIMVFGLVTVNEAFLLVDFVSETGQNFTQIYQNTTQIGIEKLINTADNSGLLLILGMVVVMTLIGFFFRTDQKLWIAFDIFILVISFTVSVYLLQSFETFVLSNSNITAIYSNEIPNTFRIINNLPILLPVVGILVMFVTYGLTKKKRETESVEGLGF